MRQVRGEWLIIGAAVLWGTTGTAQALAPSGATPLGLGAARLLIGGAALLAIAAARGALRFSPGWPPLETLLAGACIAGYQVCFLAGLIKTGVAVGTIVAIGSAPVIAGALSWLLEGKRPGARWAGATALAILSCALLAFSGGELTFQAWGILLALGAGGCYAVYALASKRLLAYHPPEGVMAVIFCLGALLLSPLLLVEDLSWLGEPGGWAVALQLGLVATALAYTLFGQGLKTVPAASAVTFSLAEPLTAGLLGVLLLGERLTALGWIGIVLLFLSLVLLARP